MCGWMDKLEETPEAATHPLLDRVHPLSPVPVHLPQVRQHPRPVPPVPVHQLPQDQLLLEVIRPIRWK